MNTPQPFNVAGRVRDAETGVPMWLAHIAVIDETGAVLMGAVSLNDGAFLLPGYTGGRVRVTYVGYEPKVFLPVMDAYNDVTMTRGVDLPEVVIFPDGSDVIVPPDVLDPGSDTGAGSGVRPAVVGGIAAAVLLLVWLLGDDS